MVFLRQIFLLIDLLYNNPSPVAIGTFAGTIAIPAYTRSTALRTPPGTVTIIAICREHTPAAAVAASEHMSPATAAFAFLVSSARWTGNDFCPLTGSTDIVHVYHDLAAPAAGRTWSISETGFACTATDTAR